MNKMKIIFIFISKNVIETIFLRKQSEVKKNKISRDLLLLFPLSSLNSRQWIIPDKQSKMVNIN